MRRKDREMDREFGLNLIDRCQYAVLATVNPDGTPYCIPVSAVRKDNAIYFHCAKEGQKTDNMRANSSVCLSFIGDVKAMPERFTTSFESAVVKGTAKEITDKNEKIEALRLICLKYAADYMDNFESAIKRSLAVTAIWKIDINELTSKKRPYEN